MLYLTYAIAQGRDVFGLRAKKAPALYVAAEGEAGMWNRLRAQIGEYGMANDFHWIGQRMDLLSNDRDLDAVIEAALEIGAEIIVIDTLSRTFGGGDENSPKDMARYIANVDELRERTGAHVAIVHHTARAKPGSRSSNLPRGHSSLEGAADMVLVVASYKDGKRTASVAMAKDDPDDTVLNFRLEMVTMDANTDSDSLTTCIVEESDSPGQTDTPQLSKSARSAFDILANLIEHEGRPRPADVTAANSSRVVLVRRWQVEFCCRDSSTSKTPASRERAFRRARDELSKKDYIADDGRYVWLTRPAKVDGDIQDASILTPLSGPRTDGHP